MQQLHALHAGQLTLAGAGRAEEAERGQGQRQGERYVQPVGEKMHAPV